MPRRSGRGIESRLISEAPEFQPTLTSRLSRGSFLPHLRPADRHARDEDGRDADADGHRLPVLAAGPAAVAELEVVADGGDLRQDVGAVADEVDVADGR